MLDQLFYWRDWSNKQKVVIVSLLFVLIGFTASFVWHYYIASESAYQWEQHIKPVEVAIGDKIKAFGYTFHVDAPNFVSRSWSVAQTTMFNPRIWYMTAIVWLLALSMILTVVSFLQGIRFYIGQTIIILWLYFSQTDLLLLFNSPSNWFMVLGIIVLLGPTNFFSLWQPRWGWPYRLLTFMGACVLLFGLIEWGANISYPMLRILHAGMSLPIALSALLIMLISWEIPYLFLRVTRGTMQFTGLMFLYLADIALIYFMNRGIIDSHFFTIDVFVFGLLSVFLSIWGGQYLVREQFKWLLFRPFGLFLILSLAVIFMSTLNLAVRTGNDSLIEVFTDLILITHFSFGAIFYIYTLGNFSTLINRKLSIWKVVYRPNTIPFYAFIVCGLIGVLALFAESKFLPLSQSFSAYYNAQGDLHTYIGEDIFAKDAYLKSKAYGYNNHHAYYQLAQMAFKEQQTEEAITYLDGATAKNPTTNAFILKATYMDKMRGPLAAVAALNKGVEVFSWAFPIRNNLGLYYQRLSVADSAAYFLTPSRDFSKEENRVISKNLIAGIVKGNIAALNKEQWAVLDPLEGFVNERLVYGNKFKLFYLGGESGDFSIANLQKILENPEALTDKSLTILAAVTASRLAKLPFDKKVMQKVDSMNIDENTRMFVDQQFGLWAYADNQFEMAFDIYEGLRGGQFTETNTKAIETMGLFALGLNAPRLANRYLGQLRYLRHHELKAKYVIAKIQSGNYEEANALMAGYATVPDFIDKTGMVAWLNDALARKEYVDWSAEGDAVTTLAAEAQDASKADAFDPKNVKQIMEQFWAEEAYQKAYEFILKKLRYNPYNNTLNELYIVAAGHLNLTTYAEEALDELKDRMEKHRFELLKQKYEQTIARFLE